MTTSPATYQVAPAAFSVPHSREAEEAAIGAVLINPDVYAELSQFLRADDFYLHRNKWIWGVFSDLHLRRLDIDIMTVSDALENAGKLAEVGGSAYITSLINQTPSSLSGVSYASIVKEHSDRRKGIAFANLLAGRAYDESKPFDLRNEAVKVVQTEGGKTQRVSTREAASRAIDQMIQDPKFCVTGIPNLDKRIGGLFQDELIVLAGYQGSGKSALAIQIIFENAKKGKRTLYCSLEMTAGQVWMRKACADLQIDLNNLRSGRVDSAVKGQVAAYAAELAEEYSETIVIYEAPMTAGDILSAAMLEQPDIVLVDHLRLINGKIDKNNRSEWYNDCIRLLRQEVAKEEHCSVVFRVICNSGNGEFHFRRIHQSSEPLCISPVGVTLGLCFFHCLSKHFVRLVRVYPLSA